MKKLWIIGALVIALCVGCGTKEQTQESQGQTVSKEDDSTKTGNTQKEPEDKKEQNVQPEQKPQDTANSGTAEQKPATETYNVYLSDDNAENLVTTQIACAPENKQAELWAALISQGALNSDCELLSLEQNGNSLILDVNQAFGNQLRSMGTSGERMMMGSVVNTYLDAYGCDSVMITEEGAVLCSGHALYDQYLERF